MNLRHTSCLPSPEGDLYWQYCFLVGECCSESDQSATETFTCLLGVAVKRSGRIFCLIGSSRVWKEPNRPRFYRFLPIFTMVACSGLQRSLRLRVAVLAALCAKAVSLVIPRSEANRALPSSSASTFNQVACEADSLPLSVSSRQEPAQLDSIVTNASCTFVQNKSAQRYIILGGFDSGTNLLHQMMFRSWTNSTCLVFPSVWKHAATGVEDIYNHLSSQLGAESLRNTVILHTLRSPVSQLASWAKAPYDLTMCVHSLVSKNVLKTLAFAFGVCLRSTARRSKTRVPRRRARKENFAI